MDYVTISRVLAVGYITQPLENTKQTTQSEVKRGTNNVVEYYN